jgi:hypothetical protein
MKEDYPKVFSIICKQSSLVFGGEPMEQGTKCFIHMSSVRFFNKNALWGRGRS